MRIVVIGSIGSDAGYWYIDETGLHHVGGWGVDQLVEFRAAIDVIGAATRFKTPGMAEAAIKSVQVFAEKQIAQHLTQGQLQGKGGGATGAATAGADNTIVVVLR
jgi:hypothetical protein